MLPPCPLCLLTVASVCPAGIWSPLLVCSSRGRLGDQSCLAPISDSRLATLLPFASALPFRGMRSAGHHLCSDSRLSTEQGACGQAGEARALRPAPRAPSFTGRCQRMWACTQRPERCRGGRRQCTSEQRTVGRGWGRAAQWSRSSGENRTRRGADNRPGLEVRRPDVCPNWLCGFHQIDHLLRTPAPLATHLCKALEFCPSKGGPQNE